MVAVLQMIAVLVVGSEVRCQVIQTRMINGRSSLRTCGVQN